MIKCFDIAILVLLLAIPVYSRFKIISPEELKQSLDLEQGYPFTIAKYGNVPYGTNQLGNLVLANPIKACSELQKLDDKIQFPVLLVERGDCTFAFKSRYAQKAGAKLVIIMDNLNEGLITYFGTPNEPDIIIPTIMIEKIVGDKIVNYITQKSNQPGYMIPQMSIKYPTGPFETDHVKVRLWFSSADTTGTAYPFLREIAPVLSTLPRLNFLPLYVSWPCADCAAQNYRNKELAKDCISGGRYCAPDPDQNGPLTGKNVMIEDIRQICIVQTKKSIWWTYVDRFSRECLNNPQEGECGDQIMDAVTTYDQLDEIEKCIEGSFIPSSGKKVDRDLDENLILQGQRELQNSAQLANFPALIISGHQYYGKLDAKSVLAAVCENYVDAPLECNPYLGNFDVPYDTQYGNIFTIVVIMSIFTCIILFFYRRMVKREMTKEMSIQISNMVSQYFTLNEEAQSMRRKEGGP